MESIYDQILRIPLIEKDKIEEGSKVDHSIDINQIFDEKLKNLGNSSTESRTIFKVNVWLRESNPGAYTPKMVSIGPYHKKKVQLRPMEKYKWLYLRRFLGQKEGLDVKSCISELEKLKEKAINCYEDVEDDSQFCHMLLLDGCFVVEFIRECRARYPEGEDKIIKYKDNIINDNIVDYIVRDLLLLENQLPFFVLDKLHDMTRGCDELELGKLATASIISLPFFAKYPDTTILTGGNIKHLLDLIHAISCNGNRMEKPKDDLPRPSESFIEAGGCYNIKNILQRYLGHAGNGKDNYDQTWHMVMQNATELSEAGVSFEKVNVKTTLFDSIEFKKGLMKIPCFEVDDYTELFLRNLIAYEQQSSDVQPKYFSDFSTFMDYLIDSDKDVNLLRQKGIIENLLGDDKEVANLFNRIGNGVLITDRNFYYKEECRKAVKHSKKLWNKMKANLLRNYFSSPWAGASTVAAIILLVLTTIQTVLAFTGSIQ